MESTTSGQGGGETHAHLGANPSGGVTTDVAFAPGAAGTTDTGSMQDRAGEMAGQARNRVTEIAAQAREKATQAMGAIENSGAMNMVRDNPLPALGIAFGVGFVLAGSSGTAGRMGKTKHQLKGAVMGGLSAAIAQELHSLLGMEGGSGGPGGMLQNVLGQDGGRRPGGHA